MATRVAVLASGRGSNLRALHEYLTHDSRSRGVRVTLVLADRPDAGALTFATEHKISAVTMDEGTGRAWGSRCSCSSTRSTSWCSRDS